jgi:hypothetical protein
MAILGSIFTAYSENAEIAEEALDHEHYFVIALWVGRAKEEARVRDEGQRVMHDSFGDFSIFESDLDPKPLNLRIPLKKFDLDVIVAALESLDEEEGFGAAQIYYFFAPVGELESYVRRQTVSG